MYNELISMLSKETNFSFINNSSPKLDNLYFGCNLTEIEIQDSLKNKILHSQSILIIYSKGCLNRKWIKYEIDIARDYNKPTICINPFLVRDNCINKNNFTTNIRWDSESIVNAVKSHAVIGIN